VIDGLVYDITSYIPLHPTDPSVLLAWCGKESTEAWEDKGGIGESHSSRADAALDAYEIGQLGQ
jgi:cytochrome b involved in lipid metabolism